MYSQEALYYDGYVIHYTQELIKYTDHLIHCWQQNRKGLINNLYWDDYCYDFIHET